MKKFWSVAYAIHDENGGIRVLGGFVIAENYEKAMVKAEALV